MRNPERIKPFYMALAEYHEDFVPDWRFCQLIENFKRWVFSEKGIVDIFYIEDDKAKEYLEEYFNSMKARSF